MTPFAWLEKRVSFGRSTLRWAAVLAVAASVLIFVTGAIVRVTGSGLGCPTWPSCTADTLAPTAEMGVHGLIEFGNRLLTGVLCAIVGWLIIVARLQREPVPQVTRWAWAQFWIVVLNAVVGGITVLARLSPYVVAAHFLAATLLLTAATIAWHKVGQLDRPARTASSDPAVRGLATALLVLTAILLVAGTVVTGTGPHAGDSSEVERIPLDWTVVTIAHAVTAAAVFAVAVLMAVKVRAAAGDPVRIRITVFLIVFLGQGLVGLVQVATALPELVVVLHLLGSALVWIGAIRVFLDTRPEHTSAERKVISPRPATV
ncbi:COX15/CtaA family protein [Microbacterium lacticum]